MFRFTFFCYINRFSNIALVYLYAYCAFLILDHIKNTSKRRLPFYCAFYDLGNIEIDRWRSARV